MEFIKNIGGLIMFTIKLGTGKTFKAISACEYYRDARVEGQNCEMFTAEDSAPENSLEWYREILEEEGALDSIDILKDEDVCMTVVGYTVIDDISMRLLSSGAKYLSINLSKPFVEE